MTNETRDTLAREYCNSRRESFLLSQPRVRALVEEAFVAGYDTALLHDPAVRALRDALRTYANKDATTIVKFGQSLEHRYVPHDPIIARQAIAAFDNATREMT